MATTRLHRVLAQEKGVRRTAGTALTDAYHRLQKTPLLTGVSRTYTPRDEDGEQLPSETNLVQVRVANVLSEVEAALAPLLDVVFTKDCGNTAATADVVVDGQTILADVPVTYLLWLEKQLTDIHTFFAKLPSLDPSDRWLWSEIHACYVSDPAETLRSKKVPKSFVRAPATDKHPAQADMYYEDTPVGTWTTIKFSGALPLATVRELVERVERLQEAVRVARSEANGVEIDEKQVARPVLDFLLGPALRPATLH